MMKFKIVLAIIMGAVLLSSCASKKLDKPLSSVSDKTILKSTNLAIDSDVCIENGDADVALLNELGKNENNSLPNHRSKITIVEDMTLFTPEDILLLDNIGNQDWGFETDSSWILRFDDDILMVGQENGQVTDVLKYHITSIDHSQHSMIIHIVERVNEYAQVGKQSIPLNYYCEVVLSGDRLTYKNKINDKSQLTETIWKRKG